MTYFKDVYKKRGEWWGNTSKEQYINTSKKFFSDFLSRSPNADIITVSNSPIDAAILDNKEDENKISKFFLTSLEDSLEPGNLISWYEEIWLVLQKEKRSFEAYNKVLAVKCNHILKWIDDFGVLVETPCYIFGHMSSRVEDNFRMASGLMAMPQPNKRLNIILPYYLIKSEQRFIIKGEAWRTLERDLVSVNGIVYLSLMEDLVDHAVDNLILDVAGYDKINTSFIEIGIDSLSLGLLESFTFNPILYQNDKIVQDAEFLLASNNENIVSINDYTITAEELGATSILISLVGQPDLIVNCVVEVVETGEETTVLQLVGDENVRWGRTRSYTVLYSAGGVPSEIPATFSLLNNQDNLVSFVSQDVSSCIIVGNTNGLAGQVILRAITEHGTVDKVISVMSVW